MLTHPLHRDVGTPPFHQASTGEVLVMQEVPLQGRGVAMVDHAMCSHCPLIGAQSRLAPRFTQGACPSADPIKGPSACSPFLLQGPLIGMSVAASQTTPVSLKKATWSGKVGARSEDAPGWPCDSPGAPRCAPGLTGPCASCRRCTPQAVFSRLYGLENASHIGSP